jgi:hypothetical protein
MNPTNEITTEQEVLSGLAEKVAAYQQEAALSDAALCKKFAGLGSTKTFKRILSGDFSELDIERQTHNYSQVLALIQAERDSGTIVEPDYDDLPHVTAARLAVTDAIAETGNDRLVIVQGETGSGKSSTVRCLKTRWPNLCVQVEANETWKKPHTGASAMLNDILTALKCSDIPVGFNSKLQKTITLLCARKLVLLVDEGHHLGPQSLNIVKTIINSTPTVVVLLVIPTLIHRLEKSAYQECRQLTVNRLSERVVFEGPDRASAAKFIARRGVTFADKKTEDTAVIQVVNTARNYGQWKFVNLVVRRARRDSHGQPMDLEQFIAAQQAVIKTR